MVRFQKWLAHNLLLLMILAPLAGTAAEPAPYVTTPANQTPELLDQIRRQRAAVDPVAWAIQLATGIPVAEAELAPGVFARAEVRRYDDFTVIWRLAPGTGLDAVKVFRSPSSQRTRIGLPEIVGAGETTSRTWGTPDDAGVSSLSGGNANGRDGSWTEVRATVIVPFTNFSVSNTNDSGSGSLRQAMTNAMADSNDPHIINITATGTISLQSALPEIVNTSISINGPGAGNLTVQRAAGGNYTVFTTPNVLYSTAYGFSGMRIRNGGGMTIGGGVKITGGSLSLNQVVIADNASNSAGGGLNVGSSAVTITNSTFSGNSTGLQGGAINAQGATLTISNTTFSGNQTTSTSGIGAALFHFANATTLNLTNCTFSGNSSSGNQTKGLHADNVGNFRNTVFQGASPQIDGGGANSLGNNLSSDGNGLGAAGDLANTQALLAPLGSYGGQTTTHALLPGSPAINAGTATGAPSADQRGIGRVGTTDIGAFESRGFTLTRTGGNNQSAFVNDVYPLPMEVAVSSSAGEPVHGGRVLFVAPASGASVSMSNANAGIIGSETSTPMVANGIAGAFTVTANTSGNLGAAVTYALTNIAVPTLSISNVTRDEGDSGTQVLSFLVTRTGTTASATTFSYATANDTATVADNDYVAASGSATIPGGGASGSATFNVTINGDAKFENTERFFVNLSAPGNATISDGQGIATLSNDDDAPTLAINNVSIIEGDTGTSNLVFTVTRTGLTALPASFLAATANGTATAPSDFVAALTGSTTIAAGGATATTTLTATINGDFLVEPNETFSVNLSAPANATIADAQGTGTISNDDTAGVVIVESGGTTAVTEGSGSDSYTLVLTSQPTSNVSIALNPGTQLTAATSPVLFTPANWNTPQTVTVTAVDDGVFEGPHTGTISHAVTSADGIYNGLAVANVVASITDNDPNADFTVTTTASSITITDSTGNGSILVANEVVANTLNFSAPGRTFSVNGGAPAADSGNLPLSGITSIQINAAGAAVPGSATFNIGGATLSATNPLLLAGGILKSTGPTAAVQAAVLLTDNSRLSGDLTLHCAVSGNFTLRTIGAGSYRFASTASTFARLQIDAGTVVLMGDNTLPPQIDVFNSGAFDLNGFDQTIDFYAGAGATSNSGAAASLTLGVAGSASSFGTSNYVGEISGPINLRVDLAGNQTLGSNLSSYTGTTNVLGTLRVTGTSALGAAGAGNGTTVAATGVLQLRNVAYAGSEALTLNGGTLHAVTGGPSSFAGPIALGTGGVVDLVTDDPLLLSGVLSGSAGFLKGGTSSLTLAGANTWSGSTVVQTGTLLVTGSTTSGLQVSGGTLGGTGTIGGPILSVSPAILAPGVTIGTLHTANVTLNAGVGFAVDVNGPTAGSQYDQLDANGSVSLGGATLTLSGSHVPITGQSFVLIDNDGSDAVSGTFAGLPNGAGLLFNGVPMQIRYNGGDGNDVVLQAVPTVSIAVAPAAVFEDGAGSLVYTVTRSTASPTATTVNIGTAGSASAGDYTGAMASATIPANSTTTNIVIDPVADGSVEPDETVILTVATGSGYVVGAPESATGTIRNDDAAGVTLVQSGGTTAVTEGGNTDSYTLVLTSQPTSNVSIALNPGTQLTAATSPVVFTPGNWSTAQTVTVTAVDDAVIEGPHTGTISHVVSSADATYNGMALGNVNVDITDNDLARISIDNVQINEGDSGTRLMQFTVTRTGTTPDPVTFSYATADDTALAGSDYEAASGTGTIPGGGASATTSVLVTLLGDSVHEDNERFFLNLSAPVNAALANNQGIGIISNDDAAPTLAIADVSIVEGNTGTSNLVFTVTRTGLTALPASFTATTANGTATAPSDYLATLSGATTIAPGGATGSTTLVATVNGDSLVEADETFLVNLSGPVNATFADAQGIGTLTNDDAVGLTLVQTGGTTAVTEGGSTDIYSVVLNSQPTANVVVALAATQVATTPTALTFTPGNWNVAQNVTVTAIDDAIAEGPHTGSVQSTVTSADLGYAGLAVPAVSVAITDNDSAAILVTPSTGLITTEAGGTANFTVVLGSEPTAAVSIGLSSSDPGEGTVSPASLSFSPGNWNTAQTVTVTGVDDAIVDGTISYQIITASAVSADSQYQGLAIADVALGNTDDDTAGITVVESAGSTQVTEGGATDSYTVVLTSQPTASVTLALSGTQVSAATTPVTFTTGNWNVAQTVTVSALDDAIAEGPHNGSVATVVSSGDSSYDGLAVPPLPVVVTDNDSVGITVVESAGSTAVTEGGATDQYTVVLGSEPTATVTILLTGTQVSAAPTPLSFTASNWNQPQTVTVTAIDDAVVEGNHAGTVTATVSSADAGYAGFSSSPVMVAITDNDNAGSTVSPTSGLVTTEAGGTATFTVVLNSQPIAAVAIGLSSSDGSEGSVSPAALTFTGSNWNTPQTVTVTGVDDALDDGDVDYRILTAPAVSTDPAWSGVDAADVDVRNADNDAAPTFASGAALSRQQGSPASSGSIGTVADADQLPGTLQVAAIGGGTATGITVTGLGNVAGAVSAALSASCTATSGTLRFEVRDDSALSAIAELQVDVLANTPPTLTYADLTVPYDGSATATPATGPVDNGSLDTVSLLGTGGFTGVASVSSAGVVQLAQARPAGPHVLQVRVSDQCGARTDATLNVTVGTASTFKLVTANVSPSRFGQPVTFSAQLAGVDPSGTVEFLADGVSLGTATLQPSPSGGNNLKLAHLTTSALPVGTAAITAVYAGDAGNAASTSSVLNHPVQAAATRITLVPPGQPGSPGSQSIGVQVSADAPGGGVPQGQVLITGGNQTCTAVLLGGSGNCVLPLSQPGLVALSANFTPANGNHLASSGAGALVIVANPSSADLRVRIGNGQRNVGPDAQLRYEIVVDNLGDAAAAARLEVPLGPDFLAGSASWTCAGAMAAHCGGASSGTGGLDTQLSVAPGGVLLYVLTVRLAPGPERTVTQSVSISPLSPTVDPVPANNTASDSDPMGLLADGYEAVDGSE